MKLVLGLIFLGFLGLTYCCESPAKGAKNLARNGVATQISNFNPPLPGYASNAIDGNRNGNYYDNSCTHTSLVNNAWWKVDLKQSYKITNVIIANRQDCCKERLRGAQVRVGNSPNVKDNPLCGTITDVTSSAIIPLCCNGMEGQYVGVIMPASAGYLTLCEVEIYGQEITKSHICW